MEMMKTWESPKTVVQSFEAQEYTSACWKINCNVPGGNRWAYLYNESNGQEGLQTGNGGDELLLSGNGIHGCEKWHNGIMRDEAPTANGWWAIGNAVYKVFWWIEDLGSDYDYHASLLGSEDYETNWNAS